MEKNCSRNTEGINIVFSDVLGTLIRQYGTEEEYAEEFKMLAPMLNNYLSDNNFLVLVTALDHQPLDSIVDMFQDITEIIEEKNRDNIIYFISKAIDLGYSDFCVESEPKIKMNAIGNKKESIDVTREMLKGYHFNNVIGIGNDVPDVDMLLAISEIRGHSILKIENFDRPIDSLIDGIVFFENSEERRKLRDQKESDEYKELLSREKIRNDELLADVNNGGVTKKTLNDLYNLLHIERRLMFYSPFYVENRQEIHEKILLLDVSETFPDLSDLVKGISKINEQLIEDNVIEGREPESLFKSEEECQPS